MLNLESYDFETISPGKFKQFQSESDHYFIGSIRDCEEFIDEHNLNVFELYHYEDATNHYAVLFNEKENKLPWA